VPAVITSPTAIPPVTYAMGVGRDGNPEPGAQGREPLELLALLEPGDHRRIVDDADEGHGRKPESQEQNAVGRPRQPIMLP
jgi:hypothetical protein